MRSRGSCDRLLATSLLYVHCLQNFCKLKCRGWLSTGLLQVVSTSFDKSANDKQLQVGKIDNLRQDQIRFALANHEFRRVSFLHDHDFCAR